MRAQADDRSWRRFALPQALPSLDGWAWYPFIAAWSLLLAVCVGAAVLELPDQARWVTEPLRPLEIAGLEIDSEAAWPTVGQVGDMAARAGVRRGDRLVRVNGAPAASDAAGLQRQFAGTVGGQVAVAVAAPDGAVTPHLLTRDPGQVDRALAAVYLTRTAFRIADVATRYLSCEVLLVLCAAVLMLRRAHDPLAPWASLMMLSLVPGDGLAGHWLADLLPHPVLAFDLFNAVAFALMIVVLCVFPTGRFEPRWSLGIAVLGVVQAVVSQPLPGAISNAMLFLTQVAAVATIVLRYRRMPPGTGRQQIRWALLGFAASTLMLLIGTLFQAADLGTGQMGVHAWLRLASHVSFSALTALLMISLTTSLLRWRLYDADVTISRSIVYGALTLGLLAAFAGSEKLVELMGEEYFGERLGALAGVLAAATSAVCIVPLHHRVSRWAEKRFRTGLVHLRHGLPLLVGDMRETATPQALADAMLARVEAGVRARHGAVVVGNAVVDARDIAPDAVSAWLAQPAPLGMGTDALHCDRADPLFPVRLRLAADGAGPVGWLLLGPRPDGSFYGREERATLREIADPVARALAIATQRQGREAARREEVDDLRRQLGALRRLIAERFGDGDASVPAPA